MQSIWVSGTLSSFLHALMHAASLSDVRHVFQIGQPKEQTQRQEQTEKEVRRT